MNALTKNLVIYIISLYFGVITGSTTLNAATWQSIKPTNGKKSSLKIDGKERSYWKLDKSKAVEIKVVGPAKLKVISRAVMPSNSKEVLFGFVSHLDGKGRKLIGRAAEAAKNATVSKSPKETLSESRTVIYKVPAGEHTYSFVNSKSSPAEVYVKFSVLMSKTDDVPLVAYLPRKFQEETRITVKEKEYIYYRAQKGTPIELEIIGPTQVKGIVRLEFDHSMRGEKPYRVQVMENGKVIMTQPFTGAISATASYSKPYDKVIGRGDTFIIDVPAGKHQYKVATPDDGTSILMRFYLPQTDLGNTPKKIESMGILHNLFSGRKR